MTTLTLIQALDAAFATNRGVTRPRLMDRNSYICIDKMNGPLQLRRFDTPLCTAWVPTPEDMFAFDWQTVSLED